jgi:outer membrane protein
MRRCLFLALFILLATSSMAYSAEFKLGVIDSGQVIQKSEAGQRAFSQLNVQFKDMKTELDRKRDDIQKLRDDLQKQSMALSQEAKQDKELEFKRKVRDFQDLLQNYQTKMRTEEEKLSKPIIEVLVQVIGDFGKRNGYSAIVDGKQAGMMYVDQTVDITEQVVAELNKAWTSKPASSAPSAPSGGGKDSKKK